MRSSLSKITILFFASVLIYPTGAQEKTQRRRNIVEIRSTSKHVPLVLTLIETDDGRSLVAFDPFSKKVVTRRVGENFVNLADLLSSDESFLVLPLGFSEEFEVYRVDDTLFESLKNRTSIWCFQIVTQQEGTSTVQNYGGWKDDKFGVSVEFGGATILVICDAISKTITTTGALKSVERSNKPGMAKPKIELQTPTKP